MIRRMMRHLGTAIDCALDRMTPLEVRAKSYLAMRDVNADRLAESEAAVEVTEPPLLPWEQELVAGHLWAAEQRHGTVTNLGDGQTIDDLVRTTRQPAGAVATPPASATGAGGSPTTDEVATVAAVILRRQGILSAPIYADLVARELRHHFDITRK